VSQKVSTFWLSVTLSNLNQFSKVLHCWEAHEICYKTHDITYVTLGMLLHYLGETKNSNFLQIWWIVSSRFCSKFHMLSSSAKILEIGSDLTKLQTVKWWELFWDTMCINPLLAVPFILFVHFTQRKYMKHSPNTMFCAWCPVLPVVKMHLLNQTALERGMAFCILCNGCVE